MDQNRALRQARLHRQRDARARDRAEIAQFCEELALKPQYVVLPVEKNWITNEMGTQTDADAVCFIGSLYGCSQADCVGENGENTKDVVTNEIGTQQGADVVRPIGFDLSGCPQADGVGENEAALVIQRSWRLFLYSRRLNSELREFARMAGKIKAPMKRHGLWCTQQKITSRMTLLVTLCGDKLNSCGGVYPEWMVELAEGLVGKTILRKDAVAAENG